MHATWWICKMECPVTRVSNITDPHGKLDVLIVTEDISTLNIVRSIITMITNLYRRQWKEFT